MPMDMFIAKSRLGRLTKRDLWEFEGDTSISPDANKALLDRITKAEANREKGRRAAYESVSGAMGAVPIEPLLEQNEAAYQMEIESIAKEYEQYQKAYAAGQTEYDKGAYRIGSNLGRGYMGLPIWEPRPEETAGEVDPIGLMANIASWGGLNAAKAFEAGGTNAANVARLAAAQGSQAGKGELLKAALRPVPRAFARSAGQTLASYGGSYAGSKAARNVMDWAGIEDPVTRYVLGMLAGIGGSYMAADLAGNVIKPPEIYPTIRVYGPDLPGGGGLPGPGPQAPPQTPPPGSGGAQVTANTPAPYSPRDNMPSFMQTIVNLARDNPPPPAVPRCALPCSPRAKDARCCGE
jgi:hypothetical protein